MALKRTAGNLLENIMGGSRDKKAVQKKTEKFAKPLEKQDVSPASGLTGFVNTREKRSGILHIRISDSTRRKLDILCKESRSSQATVVESLIDAAMDGRISDS